MRSRAASAGWALFAATVLTWSGAASAYGIGSPGDRDVQTLLYGVPAGIEVLIPDLRYELSSRPDAWVLSWPVHLRLVDSGGIRQTEHTTLAAPRAELTAFLEPQIALHETTAYRGLTGLRGFGGLPVGAALFGLVAEGGGLIGTDGTGGFVGGGLAFAMLFDHNFPYIAVVARHAWTTQGTRVDFAVDVVLPFPIK
ncbi:MAG: hypothetical protein WBV82_02340 [Myxococcaceae bacterium]